jgi:hypothetical protein
MSVVKFKSEIQPKVPRVRSPQITRAVKRQAMTATGIGVVAATLTGLSLSHLAHGIELVTASPSWQAWAMAVGIDLGFVALELAQVTISDKLRKSVSRYSQPAIVGTLCGSAALNAFAFAGNAQGPVMQIAGVVMGIAVPALIYALTRVGAAIYVDCHNRG